MTRLLLTLLALFTGLVASGASAEVRVCAAKEAAAGMLGQAEGEEGVAARKPGISVPRMRNIQPGQASPWTPAQAQRVCLATVQIGPDRARE